MLIRTEAELKNTRLSQARLESTNSAKLAAQSAGQFPNFDKSYLSNKTTFFQEIFFVTFAALVERLSSVQREREKALATQLRSALEDKEKLQRRLLQNGYKQKGIDFFSTLSHVAKATHTAEVL